MKTPTVYEFATSPIFLNIVKNPENLNDDLSINWDFVSAELHILLDGVSYDLNEMIKKAADFYLTHS